jgi:hypothetical protein
VTKELWDKEFPPPPPVHPAYQVTITQSITVI